MSKARVAALFIVMGTGVALAQPAQAGSTVTLTTSLNGAEVPTGGDRDATGFATLVIDKSAKSLCFNLNWSAVDGTVTATHVHVAPVGQVGPGFVALFGGMTFGGTDSATGCVPVTSSQISALTKTPSNYYVNLHSTTYPDGAIRGQLGD